MTDASLRPFPSRRNILKGGATLALSAAGYRRVLGANERVNLGFIGFGLIGKRHLLDFKDRADANVAAVAEVHRGRLDEAVATAGGSPRKFSDFRGLLDDNGIDAVVVSTPDHWHALMAIMACAAGKDVYVEKPLSLFVREGRWMVEAARRHKRVVQVGTQQRSGPHYKKARELVRGGHIGKVVSVRAWAYAETSCPGSADWRTAILRLVSTTTSGSAPHRSVHTTRTGRSTTSAGSGTALGRPDDEPRPALARHRLLGARPGRPEVGEQRRGPVRPGRQRRDARHAGRPVRLRRLDRVVVAPRGFERLGKLPFHGLEFCGTKGSLTVSRKGFSVAADPKISPENVVPRFGGAHPVGGPVGTGQRESNEARTEPVEDRTGDEYDQFRRHAADFLECVRSRRAPASDLESAHRVSTACHLANLSLRLGRPLRWDPAREAVVGDPEADARLERPYRAPWDAVLKANLENGVSEAAHSTHALFASARNTGYLPDWPVAASGDNRRSRLGFSAEWRIRGFPVSFVAPQSMWR